MVENSFDKTIFILNRYPPARSVSACTPAPMLFENAELRGCLLPAQLIVTKFVALQYLCLQPATTKWQSTVVGKGPTLVVPLFLKPLFGVKTYQVL